jgi:6-methylsalicylic acid synthase
MGKELLAKEPIFRYAIEKIDHIFLQNAGFSTVEALQSGNFSSSDQVQVLTYAMQIGLTALLRAKGSSLTPSLAIPLAKSLLQLRRVR